MKRCWIWASWRNSGLTDRLTARRLLLATTNQGKAREIKKLLAGLNFKIESLVSYPEFGRFQEKEKTFEENSRGKARFYSRQYGGLVLAEDSGLEVEALDGKPGVFSARFSGRQATDQKNIKKLLKLMRPLSESQRKARFICVASLACRGQILKVYRGQLSGRIIFEPRGQNGFGYDPVFFYAPLQKTLAELTTEEKNKISHRGRALRKVRAYLKKFPEAQ
ncbi:MAG TPA: non-canonical purine NTP pyrophosphatase, RdgB/HAM1 family [Acidobacteria bacterium]|nr:non-canonical purine NTP pyrophosphatase, RdgB/HAM1 family [Acidobacteriota bacterium]